MTPRLEEKKRLDMSIIFPAVLLRENSRSSLHDAHSSVKNTRRTNVDYIAHGKLHYDLRSLILSLVSRKFNNH